MWRILIILSHKPISSQLRWFILKSKILTCLQNVPLLQLARNVRKQRRNGWLLNSKILSSIIFLWISSHWHKLLQIHNQSALLDLRIVHRKWSSTTVLRFLFLLLTICFF
eukprot:Pompholyxophrys_punicea_v1_NODE_501_length_1831_cov_1.942568.p4 type:complete len:110 gc:universal NODE_501_length_1831_cov_1.942568:1419-1748(+)